ncbi:dienelactone hydrolase family protein [Hyphomonas sp.]|uniref:dienelactone hydrolase family protein n=1 Tax=Hyphomonas sp. TaxID=87 RepID=UPI0025BC307E|nr:dienelactone hydrolase family protein [Hyphomonas sp.]MBI1401352.1 dienelactone hydrolase family protein [Hyphomonas sp.]
MADDLKSIDVPKEVFGLYDAYCHGDLSRRAFFDGLARYAVGGLTVSMLAACVLPDYGRVQTTEGAEADLVEETVTYASPNGAGEMSGYLVRPAGAKGKLAGIVVVHENRGLNPHIRDVARRAAKAGYAAFAPDALYPLGGYPGNDDDGRALQAQRAAPEMIEDFMAAAEFLRNHEATNGRIACTGFCFGGAVTNIMAVRQPWLKASVPYYGGWPPVEDAVKVEVPLQIHLAGDDERVNAGWPTYEAALKAAGKPYEVFIYEGCQHGFHNDTTPRFNPEAAALAWSRTLDFFARHLA